MAGGEGAGNWVLELESHSQDLLWGLSSKGAHTSLHLFYLHLPAYLLRPTLLPPGQDQGGQDPSTPLPSWGLLCPALEGSVGASWPGLHLWATGGLAKSSGSYRGILGTWASLAPLAGTFPFLSPLLSRRVWLYGAESGYRTTGQAPGDGGALCGDPLASPLPREALQSHRAWMAKVT